jgi:ABC-2 type transport system ATP-binding protein
MDDELIKFKNVKKRFGKNTILDLINLEIPEGKITGIIGASGEGKTTILKLLVGFYKPTNGEILYAKRNIKKDKKTIKRLFGFATEDGSFHERLTVMENMVHFGLLHHLTKRQIKERAEELLRLTGIDYAKNTLAGNLSMGMKKRLDVAISLIHNPDVLIMDEPTADLDPLLRANMLSLIKSINRKGTTIILTTQLLGEMDKICDKIAILYNKNIIDQGIPSQIKQKYNAPDLDNVFNKIFSQRNNQKEAIEITENEESY